MKIDGLKIVKGNRMLTNHPIDLRRVVIRLVEEVRFWPVKSRFSLYSANPD
jgi:hypothetical protein